MRIDDPTVQAAFEQHYQRYVVRGRAWGIDNHVKLWETASRAFGQCSRDDFEKVYDELRRSWQVFRGSRSHWKEDEAFDALARYDPRLAALRLSCVGKDDWPAIWERIQSVREIKTTKAGPSVVAVSKFLHFWNPRLFMIVDDAVVWKWVFAHDWLRAEVQRTRKETDRLLPDEERTHDDWACDLPTYFAVVVWASQLVQDNPSILREFVKYIEQCTTVPFSHEVAEYEAAAVEWFLLGLVALRPAGVTI
jgi:hypothetical protein